MKVCADVEKAVHHVFPPGHRTTDMILEALITSFDEWKSLKTLPLIFQQLTAWIKLFRDGLQNENMLEFMEFYAGEGCLTGGMLAAGFHCKSFEVRMDQQSQSHVHHDLLTPNGLRYAAVSLMMTTKDRLLGGGLGVGRNMSTQGLGQLILVCFTQPLIEWGFASGGQVSSRQE